MKMKKRGKQEAFSLIELLTALAIIGIIAAIAYPSYTSYMEKTRRLDAVGSLLKLQLDQEKFRATHTQYAENFGPKSVANLYGLGWDTAGTSTTHDSLSDHYYTLTIEEGSNGGYASGFTAKAEPKSGGLQADDSDCAVIAITQDGPDKDNSTNDFCWKR
jgi:type IV pilus assembly protein PilE